MVRCLVNKIKPEVLFIQESKLKSFDNRTISSLGGVRRNRGIGVDAEGASGGLITLWNKDFFTVKACISYSRCIILSDSLRKIRKKIVLCNIYAASIDKERRELWDFILGAQQTFSDPWGIGGDFNTVLDPSKRVGVGYDMGSVRRDASIVRDLNRAFIALIPKVDNPNSLKDYRPISLVNAMYKILAKVLANRLKKSMDSIIGESQMAFINNRQISDSFVIAEQIVHK
ncbi:hypothetical protein QYF36_013977 [Acer negundo]|nr:hypothetical protein QYF36_013977 [Acer negundo]